MKNRLLTLFNSHRHFVVYSLIGGTGATLDLVSFLVLYNVFHVSAVVSTIISISIGIINNFILNTVFNFKLYNHLWKRFISFYLVGLFGLLVSIVIIALLSGVFGVDANIAKLISIPFIVIMQFVLNKRFSFSEEIHFASFFVRARRHSFILIVGAIFIISSLSFVAKIPYPTGPAAGPDEIGHYGYNVQTLIEKHRLPVAGQDDVTAYQICRDNDFGKVTCRYSYVTYPGFNYVVSAVFAFVAHDTFGVSYLVGGRLASTFWGLVFIAFLYLAAYRLTRHRTLSAALTASAALIPQVVFVFSYINQDAHSLAISAVLGYALIRFLQDKNRVSMIIFAGAFGGLLPLAKYNYFLLGLVVIVVLAFSSLVRILAFRQLLRVVAYCLVAFLAIASFWFIRNIMLYSDVLGQSYILNLMAERPYQGKAQPLSITSLKTFTDLGFFDITFRSFWVSLGYMTYYLKDVSYEVIKLALALILVVYIFIAATSKVTWKLLIYLLGMFLVLLGAVCLSFVNSAIYDFQPQGRYIFQVITPVILLVALAYRIDNRMRFIALGLLAITVYCAYGSVDLFIRYYL